MPDVVTPAQLSWSGSTVLDEPAFEFLTAAVLQWTGVALLDGPATSFSVQAAVPKLDRLRRQEEIVSERREPSTRFQVIWQRSMEGIESAFANQQGQITDLAAIVARLEANEAATAAVAEQAAATAASDSLAKSYITPTTVLSATSAGVITITAHTRTYGDASSVSVDGGSLSGWSQGDYVQVYYDDAGRVGGAVTYQGTTGVIAQEGARHIVGGVTIPTAGEVPSSGVSPYPPGYVPDYEYYR
jgi:hypothetical protein